MTPSSGFSLVELMVVLALVGLVVVMAPGIVNRVGCT